MHNVDTLVRGKERCTLHVHSQDAARLGLVSGDLAEVACESGSLLVVAEVGDDIRPGVVSLPHGWGHGAKGTRTTVSARHAGVNINLVSPAAMVDAASGKCKADKDFVAFDTARFFEIVRVNVLGGVLASKMAIPHMLKQGGESILFTSSSSSLGGDMAQFSYGVSKAMSTGTCRRSPPPSASRASVATASCPA